MAAQQRTLPHRSYPGVMLTHDGASWIAKARLDEDVMLVGRGICPTAALNDFDEQWLGIK